MYFLEKLKQELAEDINKALKKKLVDFSDFEYPPKEVDADLALPLFKLAKELGKDPKKIATQIGQNTKCKWLEKAEAKGAYVNFYLKKDLATKEILKNGQGSALTIGKGEKVMLEYVSPNSNKPLHLGHIRNAFLGEALANILEFTEHKVTRSALVNDRGVAICKSMLAYKLWGKADSPNKSGLKSDHFVGKYYVMFEQKLKEDASLKDKVQKMVLQWEQGDKETVALWKKMQKWALDGYKETYERLGVKFDKSYYESLLYKDGQKIVEEYLKKGKFSKDKKGNVIAKIGCPHLPDKIMLRADGTAIYSTTDLALAKKRFEEGYNKIFYVVGSEQNLYFKQLFCILKKLDFGRGAELKHLSYGLVELPEGKMKSREGTVVDADDLLNKVEELVAKEVGARNDFIEPEELERRTKIISLAALKFYILNVNPSTKIKFNPKESISFTGKTGPYLLYSYARLRSILRKSGEENGFRKFDSSIDFSLLKDDATWQLVLQIAKFPDAVLCGHKGLDPEEVASYLYDLATKISDFYHKFRVLEAKPAEKKLRLIVIKGALEVMEKGLSLLGIEALEEM